MNEVQPKCHRNGAVNLKIRLKFDLIYEITRFSAQNIQLLMSIISFKQEIPIDNNYMANDFFSYG